MTVDLARHRRAGTRPRATVCSSPPHWLAPALIAVLAFALRLPGLLEPHHYADEGIFAAVAQRLLQGHALYTEAWDDKPPLIYWLYAAVLSVAGPSMIALRTVASLWAAMGAAGVTVLGRRLLGTRRGIAAGIGFAVLIALPLIEANLALTELFAATPVVWAMTLATDVAMRRRRRLFGAGCLLGVAALFKQVAALDAAALGLLLLAGDEAPMQRAAPANGMDAGAGGRKRLLIAMRGCALLVAGFMLPMALVAAVLAAQNALGEGLYAVFGFYAVYLREGSAMPRAFGIVKLAPLALACAGWLAVRMRRPAATADLLPPWLGFATLGATLAARPFGHYLVQALAPACLAAAALPRPRPSLPLALTAGAAALVIGSAFSPFWLSFPMVRPGYYAAAAARLTGRQSPAEFGAWLSWRTATQDILAPIIRADDDRTLFVWGEFPWLYPLAAASNPTRYTTAYHTSFVPGAKREVMEALRRAPPRYIVWERDEWRRLPGLASLLDQQYELLLRAGSTELYRRRAAAQASPTDERDPFHPRSIRTIDSCTCTCTRSSPPCGSIRTMNSDVSYRHHLARHLLML